MANQIYGDKPGSAPWENPSQKAEEKQKPPVLVEQYRVMFMAFTKNPEALAEQVNHGTGMDIELGVIHLEFLRAINP
jgi:hypothetical protein